MSEVDPRIGSLYNDCIHSTLPGRSAGGAPADQEAARAWSRTIQFFDTYLKA
jgi:hypothetical protein